MSCYLCNVKELKVGQTVGGEGGLGWEDARVAKWKSRVEGRRGWRRMLWRQRQVPLNVYEQNICRRIPQIGEAASRDLGKKKVGEKKKLTRQHSEMEPSKVNLSPDPQSEWLCLFMVTLPSFFPKSESSLPQRFNSKILWVRLFKRYWRNPTNRATRNICMPARGRSSDSDVTDIDGRSPKEKKTVASRTMSFVMVCRCFQFASCWLGLLEKEGPALLSGKQNIFFQNKYGR